jgi:hypothetical protein
MNELRKEGRGSYDYKYDSEAKIVIVRWLDSNIVNLSSTYCGIQPVTEVRR